MTKILIISFTSGAVFLQSIPDKAWDISPYGGAAYGALVIALGFIAWKRDQAATKVEAQAREDLKTTHQQENDRYDRHAQRTAEALEGIREAIREFARKEYERGG